MVTAMATGTELVAMQAQPTGGAFARHSSSLLRSS